MICAIVLVAIGILLYLLAPKRKRGKEQPEKYPVNFEAVRKYFKFPDEVDFILRRVEDFVKAHPELGSLVNPYAFTLAVRQQESGRPGREFGVLHPEAIDTDLKTQLEWFLWTLLKDTERWSSGKLWNNWDKDQFKDFIEYFAKKYAPVGAENDPRGLNRFWEKNVRHYYELFRAEGGEKE
ncbi:hypothetical protein [Atrimonas thermophila]|uniref:hypothetical protein n=1 Tax=Atrimonas thermophila TaxID=3064161 RepID=UPI00399C6840